MKRARPNSAPVSVLALVSLVTVLLTRADPTRAEDAKAALVHFQKGTSLFKVDKFKEALGEYQAAYVDKPDASFLFNIAQCHRKLGARPEAIRFYRKYLIEFRLDRGKDAPNAKAVQGFIDELEAAMIASRSPPPAEATAPAPPAPSPSLPSPPAERPSEPAPALAPSIRNEISPAAASPPAAPPEPASNPFLQQQPAPTQWEAAPQSADGQPVGAFGAATSNGSQTTPAGAPSSDAIDRYAARPTGIFGAQAALGYATWKEDVSSRVSDDRGTYDTRAFGPTVGFGLGLGVGYSRFFVLGDFAYRYFNSGKSGGFLPSTTMNAYEAGGRAGLRSDHVDAYGRLGWAMTSISIPNTSDDLPSEKLAGFAGGGGIDVKDVSARHLSFTARVDIGLSGERSQEKASGRDLSEGESQSTKWSAWSVGGGMPLAAGLDVIGTFGVRLVDTTFDGFSERLAASDPGTKRSTSIISLGVGLAYRR